MRLHPALGPLGPALLAAVLAACARTAEERQLDAMRADIDSIQHDRDQADRTAPIGDPAAPVEPPPPAAFPPPPPAGFEEVQVGTPDGSADGDQGYADPQDTAPRPLIRIVGRPSSHGRADEAYVQDLSTPAAASALDPAAKRAYDAALSLLRSKQYDRALSALSAFLVRWPDHPYADHAMYWRAQCYYAEKRYGQAADELEGLVARFPAGAKVPDALFALGLSYRKLGRAAEAQSCFERLARDYPDSDAGQRAKPFAARAGRDPSADNPSQAPSAPPSSQGPP